MQAQRLDRNIKADLLAGDGKAVFGQFIGDVAGVNRAIQLPGITGLANQDNRGVPADRLFP